MINGGFIVDNKEVKRARMNIYLVQELKDYIDEEARRFGLSTSAFMTMVIQNYKTQNNAVSGIGDLKNMLDIVTALNGNSNILGDKE